MRHIISAITLAATGLLALPAFAQEPREGDESDSPRRPVAHSALCGPSIETTMAG